jgi:hypothetical protein
MPVRVIDAKRGRVNRNLEEVPLSDDEKTIDNEVLNWTVGLLNVDKVSFINLAALVAELAEIQLIFDTDQRFFKRAERRTEDSDLRDWILFTTGFFTLSILVEISVGEINSFLEEYNKNDHSS